MTGQFTNRTFDAIAALARAPNSAEIMRRQPLPLGVTRLFAILAGDRPALDDFARAFGSSRDEALAAVEYYVKSVVLHADASPWRILGHEPGASRAQLRENMRLLLIWLHPDRASSEWQVGYARRVIDAWKILSSNRQEASFAFPLRTGPQRLVYTRPWIARPVVKSVARRWAQFTLVFAFALIASAVAVALFAPSDAVESWSLEAQTYLGRIESSTVATDDPTFD